MSDADGTCEYVLDPDDPAAFDTDEDNEFRLREEIRNDGYVWKCPHKSEDTYRGSSGKERKLCIFHAPKSKKDKQEVTKKLKETIEKDKKTPKPLFLGAEFETVKLNDSLLATETVDFSKATFEKLEIKGGDFEQEVYFNDTVINGKAVFDGTVFQDFPRFNSAKFKQYASFSGTIFKNGVGFIRTIFEDEASFTESEFNGESSFSHAEFHDYVTFGAYLDRYAISVPDSSEAIPPLAVDFREMVYFDNATFKELADFSWTSFDNGADFTQMTMSEGTFESSDLTGSIFSKSDVRNVNFESSLLNRSSFYDADLRGCKLLGSLLGDAQINQGTQFLGSPEKENINDKSVRETIYNLLKSKYCIYDPDFQHDNEINPYAATDKAKRVYRKLEELARQSARPKLQSKCFIRRQELQQKQYWQEKKDSDNPLEWIISSMKGIRARSAQITLLYGESPWRVIAWSLGIIFSFALLYPLGGWMKPADGNPITYAQIASNPVEILNSVYYSTLTYTALGFGDFQPVGLGRLLTTLETGLGAVMLALLVFILGRRAAR